MVTIDLPKDSGPYADCPSTGGLGSLSTLLSPLLVAADGVPVPKISANGSIAGAIDSLGLISGFRTQLSSSEFAGLLTEVGIAHVEQSAQFCPADRVLIEERRAGNKMEHAALAAVSLLGKKLAIPNCAAAFDFRVGGVGNIGESVSSARDAADFFVQVADLLGIPLAVVATDNEYSQSSAIGRIECLELVWCILAGEGRLSAFDHAHLRTCITLAAQAIMLVRQEGDLRACEERIAKRIDDGTVRKTFEKHLEAQGSNVSTLLETIERGGARHQEEIHADSAGCWMPPRAAELKAWCKKAIRAVSLASPGTTEPDIDRQVGIRLLVSPGESVERGQPVMLAAWPQGMADKILPPPWGNVNEDAAGPQILFSL